MEVSINSVDTIYVNLLLKFSASQTHDVTLDHKAFTTECFYWKDNNVLQDFLSSNSININELMRQFRFNQVIVENEDGEMKLLSVESNFPYEKDFKEVNCMLDWKATKQIDEGKDANFKVEGIDIHNLKINRSDRKIRLYYSYLSRDNGETIMARSNWVNLPN
ncbi:hypothetical protein C900_04247 [Fulvivirga imtechensis AK7]|uniref:Uncharacterized protein n=2 Tax=Fulvivirga TaxID=396811 RepID=L8JX84_9BACT|nr:hypothetical protein C900_04247 [Fulvivirga imtechensis AK7]